MNNKYGSFSDQWKLIVSGTVYRQIYPTRSTSLWSTHMFAVRAEIESQLRSTLYGVTASMFIVSLTPEHSKLTAADISSDHHQHCLHGRMKVEAGRRCPPQFVNPILLCGQTNLTLSLTNIENVVSRSYCEAAASYRCPISEPLLSCYLLMP